MIRQPSKRSLCNGFQQFLGLFQQPPRDNSKSFHCLTQRQIQDCCNIQGGALCDNSHYYHNDLQLVCCSSPRSTSATGCNFSITCILLGILRSSLECHFVKNTFAQQFCFLLKNLDFRNNRIRGNSDFLWNFFVNYNIDTTIFAHIKMGIVLILTCLIDRQTNSKYRSSKNVLTSSTIVQNHILKYCIIFRISLIPHRQTGLDIKYENL